MPNPQSLGVIVPVVGVPMSVVVNRPDLGSAQVNTMFFQVLPDNTDDVHVRNNEGILVILRPPTANHLTDLAWNIPGCPNPFTLAEYFIDAEHQGDGVRVAFLTW